MERQFDTAIRLADDSPSALDRLQRSGIVLRGAPYLNSLFLDAPPTLLVTVGGASYAEAEGRLLAALGASGEIACGLDGRRWTS